MSESIKNIVITGGPSSGKSTTIRELKESSIADKLVIVPEAATILLSQDEYAPPETGWTQEWQDNFQQAVYDKQQELNNQALNDIAQSNGAKTAIVSDRGLADGACYLEGGLSEFETTFDTSQQEIFHPLTDVLFLHSSKFKQHNGEIERVEDAQKAAELSQRLLSIYHVGSTAGYYALTEFKQDPTKEDPKGDKVERVVLHIEGLLKK